MIIGSFNFTESMIDYAKKYKIPIPLTKSKPYSSDRNLLHISHEGGILEDPWAEAPEDMFMLTKSPEQRRTSRSIWRLILIREILWP